MAEVHRRLTATQADLLSRAVAEDWDDARLRTELAAQQQRRRMS